MSINDGYDESQKRNLQVEQQKESQKQFELQKQALLRKILTPKARQRLTNLKMVRSDFVSQIELQLIQISQQGRIKIPINDNALKQMLKKLQSDRRDIKIRRL